jgi:diguanylate cyclase (GGDEF)-like protein
VSDHRSDADAALDTAGHDERIIAEVVRATQVFVSHVRVVAGQLYADVPQYVVDAGFMWPGETSDAVTFWAEIEERIRSSSPDTVESRFEVALSTEGFNVRFARLAEDLWAILWRSMADVWANDSGPQILPYLGAIQLPSVLVQPDGVMLAWNQPFLDLVDAHSPLVGKDVGSAMPSDMRSALAEVLRDAAAGAIVERLLPTLQPAPRWLRVHANRAAQAGSSRPLIVIQLEQALGPDSGQQRGFVDQIVWDPLTSLFNRRAFFDIAGLDDPASSPFVGVLLVDVRRFKSINDLWGQFVADQCLAEVARWLQSIAHSDDVLIRLSGDEFLVLSVAGSDARDMVESSGELIFTVGRQQIPVSLQAGWANRGPGQDLLQVAERAERALAAAKREAWRTVLSWSPQISEAANARIEVEEAVRKAVADRDIAVHFQPLVNLETNTVVGFEALVRLLGSAEHLPAERIIDASHRLGLTPYFADLVFGLAFEHGRSLREVFPQATIAVNVSRELIGTGRGIDSVVTAAASAGLTRSDVVIELTEELADGLSWSMLTTEMRRGVDLGIQIVIDDFGSGETSLSLLRSLPIAGIKLDRSLLPVGDDDEGWTFVERAVALLRTLTDHIIAEGVETEVQSRRLAGIGVMIQQGYLFGRPEPHTHWLENPVTFPRR